ncbi:transcriptional regulator, TetR family [Limimonas halophila]|uniref:Transcriptional regulator, TetR family n=1 Tax=Limimonas halophila TaxID=1082479 RepID=A0A1G7RN58_9PROT|nr:TetR/AcrR family transcriptional regulator [Limimonas halophila]SDG12162.1 transcriptional regulator, TetR family [Limimonas halophila]
MPEAPTKTEHAGPGRPRAFDEAEALRAALTVFWEQGYEATSVDTLIRAMGISRSSFYGCFGSKHGAMLAALRRYADDSLDRLAEVAAAERTPRAAVRAMIHAMVTTKDAHRGCLLVNCISELAARDAEITELIQRHIARVERLLAETIAEADADGAADRARALVSLTLGAITLRKAGLPPEQVDAALNRAEPLLPTA